MAGRGHRATPGFAADTTSAAVILISTASGLPLSTTQVCSGSIVGAAAGGRPSSVRRGVTGRMALARGLTVPAAALAGAGASWLATVAAPVAVVTAGAAVAAGTYGASRRHPVGAAAMTPLPGPPDRTAA